METQVNFIEFVENQNTAKGNLFIYKPQDTNTDHLFLKYGEDIKGVINPAGSGTLYVDLATFTVFKIDTENVDVVIMSKKPAVAAQKLPVEIWEDIIRVRPQLLRVDEVLSFIYRGEKYFLHKPDEGIIELYELNRD